jgi:translation initiation factor IF-3
MFRGREITHPEQARLLIDRVLNLVGDEVQVEQSAKFEGRNMTLVLAPK